jgi:hypothetical protein
MDEREQEPRIGPERPEGAVPPGGAAGGGARGGIEFQCLEFCPICRTADVVRATMPEEFREHWHAVQREGLLAMRSLLDHYIRQLDEQRSSATPVEDIPIE